MPSHSIFNDIQANVLKSHNRNYCCFLFCRWKAGLSGNDYRNWIKKIGSHVTSHQQQREDSAAYQLALSEETHLPLSFVNNLSLTYTAYQLMDSNSAPKDFEFRKGMHNRRFLPDYYGKKTTDYIGDFMQAEHHALICLANDSEQAVLQLKHNLLNLPIFSQVVVEYHSEWIKQRRKASAKGQFKGELKGPFDFKDDIAKPAPAIEEMENFRFAFTHQRENDEPDPNGTYLAAQKITCHVNAFNRYANQLKVTTGLTLSHAKALLIGRFPNGTPLDLYPSAQANKNAREENNFDYGNNNGQTTPDPLGTRCPLHAHIRSVNPRKNGQQLTPIVRRGMSYNDQRSKKQTLMFLSFQASIKNNLRPLYDNMLRGRYNDNQLDALVYQPQQDFIHRKPTNTYLVKKEDGCPFQQLKHPRSQERLSSFVGSNFYYLPSMTYLKAPH